MNDENDWWNMNKNWKTITTTSSNKIEQIPYDIYEETDSDRIYYLEEELKILKMELDFIKSKLYPTKNKEENKNCECGAEKSNTTHASWCPKF